MTASTTHHTMTEPAPRHRSRRVPTDIPAPISSAATAGKRQTPSMQFHPAVERRQVSDLRPHPRNARTHSRKQVAKIAASVRQFGFVNPVLVDREGQIIAGHGRVEAAKQLELEQVPTIQLDHLSPEEVRAYIIADNRLAELAGWDDELLALELEYLTSLELDFDVEITGFETAEIDLRIDGIGAAEPDPADEVPERDDDKPPVTRPGDLWLLGRHKLLCGDALAEDSYARLMPGETARMVFADPPYNVPIDGHVSGLGRTRHREFVMASGEMTPERFQAFLGQALARHAAVCTDGALLYMCMDWRHLLELLEAGRALDLALINLCVWNKSTPPGGTAWTDRVSLVESQRS